MPTTTATITLSSTDLLTDELALSTTCTLTKTTTSTGIEFLHIQNGHASASYNITVTAQVTNIHHQQFGSVTKSNVVKAVAAGQDAYIGPFKQSAFNDANNKVQITYSAVDALLKVSVLYLDQQ